MASRDAPGSARDTIINISSDSESDSPYGRSHHPTVNAPPPPPMCQWRNSTFHDQECSRYFDCPTHMVERVISDGESEEEEEEEEEEDEEEESRARLDQPDESDDEEQSQPGDVSPLSGSEHEGGMDIATSPDASRGVSPLPPSPERGGQETSPLAGMDYPPVPGEQPGDDTFVPTTPLVGTAENPISLDDSPVQTRGQPQFGYFAQRAASTDEYGSGTATTPVSPGPSRGGVPSRLREVYESPPTPTTDVSPRLVRGLSQQPPPAQRRVLEEIVLPRWQPDAEVTYCPICHTQFSIFVRKHHCRKCGRVVCNSCSPHRITIPYQYIVQPPGTPRLAPRYPGSFLGGDPRSPDFSALGGGERVRLCNPCVPDPNTAPPQTQAQGSSHSRSHSNIPGGSGGSGSEAASPGYNNRWSSYFGPSPSSEGQARHRSVTLQPTVTTLPSGSNTFFISTAPMESRIMSGSPPVYYQSGSSAHSHPYRGPSSQQRYRSLLDIDERPGPLAGSSSSSSPNINRRLPPTPRSHSHHHHHHQQHHIIPEEDECPVCHRELPSRNLANSETLRESHINQCITSHSAYNGGARPAATEESGEGSSGTNSSSLPPAPPRRTGMFPYTATEKDCVDSAECTICLEEFEPGVAMARLECLCRFHRACISAWWERHPGRCPMHQHDGFGY
ncbi:FYVE zinc finger-domain-containing protein [Pseudoneurospora amorphoporcata]|uniref:FYVE zinc finger-domain-containing protein n=1 Tax=Pseudoneurospora amorphoporcata TaxID=241081 RepID=A0AAN6SF66_9PEZI|nr:FYVE zinc finger-domain-containing protein [Pseudoneurospora amorphoporcata]